MTEPWICRSCSFRTLDEPRAVLHGELHGHVVVRRHTIKMAEPATPASRTPKRWVCEECPYETHEQHYAEGHETEQGHKVVLAVHAKTHPGRELATAQTTGPGAILTDGHQLFEVTGCRPRAIVQGKRKLVIQERRLVDVAEPDEQSDGAWAPFTDVMALEVVRPVAYEQPEI